MRWTLPQLAAATAGRPDSGRPGSARPDPAGRPGSARPDPAGRPGSGQMVGGGAAHADPSRSDPPGLGPITIDSREATPGSVFVPVVAERDGHRFIDAAVAAGAAAYLYQPDRYQPDRHQPGRYQPDRYQPDRYQPDRHEPQDLVPEEPRPANPQAAAGIPVADTGAALLDLGRAARQRLAGPVVGITGSVGKTSTKDLAAAAVGAGRRVTASARSFNNELGVPLTLANAADDTEVTIVEMGARGIGHIALLCDIARPTIAVVTAVAAVHTELFGDLSAVARAKGELVEALPADGIAILNGDDPAVTAMGARTQARIVRYGVAGVPSSLPGDRPAPGVRPPAGGHRLDVTAEHLTLDDDLHPSFFVSSPWGSTQVALGVRGTHQVGNALAALSVAVCVGVPFDDAVAALAGARSSPWRMELGTAPGGARILNDAYNANPTSMAAALHALHRLPARRRVAVLGAMAELGPDGPAAHRRIAGLAAELGVDVVAVGTVEYGVAPVAGVDEALIALGSLSDGDAVLVKASRVAGLERVAERLLTGS